MDLATFAFKSGAKLVIGVDTDPKPVYLKLTQGWRFATQRLNPHTAQFWAYGADWLARLNTNSLSMVDNGLIFHTKLELKTTGLHAWIYSITLWGNTYSYLRPGPLPAAQIAKAAAALHLAAAGLFPAGWPYLWVEP